LRNSVVIDCFQENPDICRHDYAVVAIDVIRATTTAITAVAAGRRCFPVPSVEAALLLQRQLPNSFLAGEVSGDLPQGFEVNNSPAEISARQDIHRPLILLSSAGTKLIHAARECDFAYLACFRNFASVSQHLVDRHPKVALIGAGTRGEFREEDQICCAWIARELIDLGYEPENERTASIVDLWGTAPAEACLCSKSVAYLRRSGQTRDLDFTLQHVNDLPHVFLMRDGEVVVASVAAAAECRLESPTVSISPTISM
jgi:2-phosphosulfolactate phosphatase